MPAFAHICNSFHQMAIGKDRMQSFAGTAMADQLCFPIIYPPHTRSIQTIPAKIVHPVPVDDPYQKQIF